MILYDRASNYQMQVHAGLMSGVKTTSLFGSLINLVICWVIHKKLKITPSYLSVLGDDIDLGYDSIINPSRIYKEYDLIQFPIAKDKTKYTKGYNTGTEFLWV